MKPEELKNGIVVCHTKYHRNYRVVSANARMKIPEHGWIDAVTYAPLYENEHDCFCREKDSFLEEFEVVLERMTAKEMIKALSAYPDDAEVVIECCNVHRMKYNEDDNTIRID